MNVVHDWTLKNERMEMRRRIAFEMMVNLKSVFLKKKKNKKTKK